MEQNPQTIIDEIIDNMTIEELKAAARVGIGITLGMMSKAIEVIRKHIIEGKKG